jgi:hypothetical protein
MFLKRQARVGQYAWLVLLAFVVSSGWIYFDTVNKTTLSTQIAALQTIPTEEGKDMVLSVTLSDGSNAKYLVKLKKAETEDAAKQAMSKEKVSSWELSRLGTALSVGDGALPLGLALKISN